MNKSKHLAVNFVTEDKALKLVNDPRFMALEEFPGDCYEVGFTTSIWFYIYLSKYTRKRYR